jgi:Asp-tRNA(Asn)/Glu-tRNA(Gln) amidotransferase A subunit family amidase
MLSALALARRIEAGELTALAVVALCAEAIAARGATSPFAALDLAAAQRAAAQAHATRLPLRGLPVGIEDIFDTATLATGYGSPIYAGHQPRSDAALVMLVRRAGGVMLGKTVTTEFASCEPAPDARNPARPPAGSGAAAALAAGMVPLALGSQAGGTVIPPAAYCGIVGFKPSFRLLPTAGMKCFSWSLDTPGLLAAGVADAAFAAAAVTGRDLRVDARPPATPAVAILRTHRWNEASAAMQDAVERAARAAERSGAKIKDLELPPVFERAAAAHHIVEGYEAFRALAFEYDNHRDRLGPALRARLDAAAGIDADTYDDARRATRRARQALADVLADGEVFLTPSAPGPVGSTGALAFNRLWTLLGTPCVNVPGLTDQAGLPLGVQIVARFGRDRFALAAAAFLEAAIVV